MLDFRLKVFCSVAHNMSFTKASQELGITQPAISKHIQELEQEFGVKLFERQNSHISLTIAGKTLLAHAECILAHYDALNFDMQLHAHNLTGLLRLGASTTIARQLLPQYLSSFATHFSHIKLSLIEGTTDEIVQAVEQKRIDVGMVESGDRYPQMRYTPFMRDEVVLVVSASSNLSAVDIVSLDELKELPLVMAVAGSDSAQLIERALAPHEITLSQLNLVMQLADETSIKQFIANADCMAFVSLQSVVQDVKSGRLKIVTIDGDVDMSREFSFVRDLSETSAIVKDFMSYMQKKLM